MPFTTRGCISLRKILYLTKLVNYVINKTMKLSTKSTYGLRAMLNIALKGNGATSITDISKNEGISVAYLEQLLNRLRRKGLIKSIRGPKGGYILAKQTNEITVGDIVKTLEGSIYPIHCVSGKKGLSNICKRSKDCIPKIVWLKLAKSISDCLDSITLGDLCIEARRMKKLK